MNSIPQLQVGSLVIAKRASGVCDLAEHGVCYEVYELAGRPGWSVIFTSGRYDGFSPEDVDTFLEVTGAVCQEVADYVFTNVGQLCRDCHFQKTMQMALRRINKLSEFCPEEDANSSRRGCKWMQIDRSRCKWIWVLGLFINIFYFNELLK